MGLRKKKSLLDQATEQAGQYAERVRPQLESAVATAKDKAGPVISDARAKAAPVLADAKAKAVPVLADARAKAGPVIASGAALAAEKVAAGATIAAERTAEAAEAAAGKIAEVAEPQPPEKKRGNTLRKLLLFTGLAAAAAYVAKRLQGRRESQNWQSSYTPNPAPTPADPAEDEAGSSPDEALADQAEAPRPVTTPDEPAQVVDVDKKNP